MIARCPACSTRHDILPPEGAATLIDCTFCGHKWVQAAAALPKADGPTAAPCPVETLPKERVVQPLVEAARSAQKHFDLERRGRRKRAAAWAVLLATSFVPAAGALAFPEKVVAAAPVSARLYELMGRQVNIYGLDIRAVDLQHLVIDGRKVIAVKGELTNVSSSERKIPWLRFGLRSNDNAEVYHWTLDTEARPLKPGESTSFVTRLASPPEAARKLEIRFARADEIGSNN